MMVMILEEIFRTIAGVIQDDDDGTLRVWIFSVKHTISGNLGFGTLMGNDMSDERIRHSLMC